MMEPVDMGVLNAMKLTTMMMMLFTVFYTVWVTGLTFPSASKVNGL